MMTLEEGLHIARHLKGHVEELRKGTFEKKQDYLDLLVSTRWQLLELAHDMVYIMREKEYKGYEDADFYYNPRLPKDLDISKHEFMTLTFDSFRTVTETQAKMEFMEARDVRLSKEDAEKQMEVLSDATRDLSVGIAIFKSYFGVTKDFDNIRV